MSSSEKINDGGPAFGSGDMTHGGYPGMSLRDWFAGQALGAIIANKLTRTSILRSLDALDAASEAYVAADAMLEAREKKRYD